MEGVSLVYLLRLVIRFANDQAARRCGTSSSANASGLFEHRLPLVIGGNFEYTRAL